MWCLALFAVIFALAQVRAEDGFLTGVTVVVESTNNCNPNQANGTATLTLKPEGKTEGVTALSADSLTVTFGENQLTFQATKEIKITQENTGLQATWILKDGTTCTASTATDFELGGSGVKYPIIGATITRSNRPTTTTTTTTTGPTTTNPESTTATNDEPTTPKPSPTTAITTPTTQPPANHFAVVYTVLSAPPPEEPKKEKCNSHNGAVVFAVIEALVIVGLVAFLLFKFCVQPKRSYGGDYPATAYYDNTQSRGDNIDRYRRPQTQDISMEPYSYSSNGNSNPVNRSTSTPISATTSTTNNANRVALPMVTLSSSNTPPLSPTTPALVPIDISTTSRSPIPPQNPNRDPLDLASAWNDPFQ